MRLTFTVHGTPIPKGSTKAFYVKALGRAIVTAANAKTKPWESAVVAAALDARDSAAPIEEPVTLDVRFYLPRPKTAPRRVTLPAKKPDLDKLVRALKDGLTRAGVYRDDSQVVHITASKDFAGGVNDPAGPDGIPRAVVEVDVVAAAQPTPGELFHVARP